MKPVPHGEPYAGKLHVRFDEGAGVPHGASRATLHPRSPLYNQFEGITWYVQAVMNRIWESGDGLAEKVQIDAAVNSLVENQEFVFYDLLRSQSDGSQTMLRAIANAGKVSKPTSGEFVANSGLRAASSAAFALNDLKSRDLVYETDSGWTVYDRLFGIWLRKRCS